MLEYVAINLLGIFLSKATHMPTLPWGKGAGCLLMPGNLQNTAGGPPIQICLHSCLFRFHSPEGL